MNTTTTTSITMTDALLAELELEAEATRRLLSSIPEDSYGWKPHEKGRSMGELCMHLSSILHGIPQMIDGDRFDVAGGPPPESAPESRDALLASVDQATSRIGSWLPTLGERMNDEWIVSRGDEQLMTMPRWMAVRWLLFNHLYHHRGQLTAYLRASGGFVPSVYGPSADDNPFAEA